MGDSRAVPEVSNPLKRGSEQKAIKAGRGDQDGVNLCQYSGLPSLLRLDTEGGSTRRGNGATRKCGGGPPNWPVHGDSERAKVILGGRDGCVTLLVPKGILGTEPCGVTKGRDSRPPGPSVPIFDHKCRRLCAFVGKG